MNELGLWHIVTIYTIYEYYQYRDIILDACTEIKLYLTTIKKQRLTYFEVHRKSMTDDNENACIENESFLEHFKR